MLAACRKGEGASAIGHLNEGRLYEKLYKIMPKYHAEKICLAAFKNHQTHKYDI